MRGFPTSGQWWVIAPLVLLVLYVSTLAPSVTLWDSGEFLSAIATLGVPHPPGTPLFIFGAAAWSRLHPWLDPATASNLASAVVTAIGCTVLGATLARGHGRWVAVSACIAAGLGSAVWQSATETEVYGWSLCLSALMVWLGARAGDDTTARRGRYVLLLALSFGLAVPLHLSALVAGPTAILFAWRRQESLWHLSPLVGAWLIAVGCGLVSLPVFLLGVILAINTRTCAAHERGANPLAVAGLVLVGVSFVLVMFVRARHDPGINQGNPSDWSSLLEVISRAQYDVPGVWPRRAPLWIQVGNLVQYWDWQFGFGLDGAPGPSWRRTPITVFLLLVAAAGARWQFQQDRRLLVAHLLLFLSASLGIVAVLNLRAGPSFGWGVLDAAAIHEARERDYFFGLAVASWGVWIALGAHWLVSRVVSRRSLQVVCHSVLLAALAFSNLSAMNRGAMPEARLSQVLGASLLASVPSKAVLVTAGDNDTYAVWYQQQVMGVRRDVVVVALPLLPARWYREELRRRSGLINARDAARWESTAQSLGQLAQSASTTGRPFAVSLGLPASDRYQAGTGWRFSGMVAVLNAAGQGRERDSTMTARVAALIAAGGIHRSGLPRDPAARYLLRLLRCPSLGTTIADSASLAQLETTCNYR